MARASQGIRVINALDHDYDDYDGDNDGNICINKTKRIDTKQAVMHLKHF